MLSFISMAAASAWNVCAATEAVSSANAGWTIVEERDTDGAGSARHGTFSATSATVRSFQPRREEDMCDAKDGVGGATRRWSPQLIAVDSLPGEGTCVATIWADGYVDSGSTAQIEPTRLAASATGHAVTRSEAGNTGTIGVDGGGGASFSAQWEWGVPGAGAEIVGTVAVDAVAAYNGATLEIPGWASVQAYDGTVAGWVRRGAKWVQVAGVAPLDIAFGATTVSRGEVCASGNASSGSSAQPGQASVGGAGIRFVMDAVPSARSLDASPLGGPVFEPCSCQ
ncbi:MAG: hypothetical protein EXR71_17005 [Myxococcales bacterium]|nr:hypothetical protein [Myxococcales bacterium]